MKKTKLMMCALCAAVLAAFVLVGCEKMDIYSIDAPSDLQSRIDSIAAANASTDSDTTYLTIATAIVGAEDNSSGWNTVFSDFFTIPTNKLLHLEFVNHGTGVSNWNNWNLAVTNEAGESDIDTYDAYFVLRSDAWGWQLGSDEAYPFDLNMVSQNYPDTDGDEDIWNDFRTTMQGAYVTLEIDHSVTGNVYVTATALGTNGTELVMTYQQPVSATEDIVAFLICDGSYFEMETAYLLPSEVTVVDDVNPTSITVEGAPSFVEIGDTNFWGDATATVTFADGSSEVVDSADISFNVVPDMTTLGEKTVVVAYSKTKQGEYGPAVSTFYTLEITNSVSSLEVTTMPDANTYTFPGPAAPLLDTTGIIVTATYSDGTTSVMPNENLLFENPGGNGEQDAVISYVGATNTVTTTFPITNVTGGTNQVGATDFSTAWWTVFANNYAIASGDSLTFKMNCYSSGTNNWNSPCTILRKTDMTEYAVVRMDSFGWGDGYNADGLSNDWDWDTFTANINDSYIEITITNVGDGTANVRYDVTYANSDTHYQLYEGITVESSDLTTSLVIEGAYIDIISVE